MGLSRRQLILKYIVEYFIKTAQPVGSNTLIEEFNLPYSSATIRNEMMELEKQGFIEKTHTSSGRVPSSKGYKYYIANLREKNVSNDIKYQISNIFTQREKSIDDVIKESCEILSHMTNLASIVLGPDAEQEHLVSIQIIPLSNKAATAVFVTDKGYVENKTFVLGDNVKIDDLKDCVQLLNDRLNGTPISHLVEKMELLRPILNDYIKNNDTVYRVLAEALLRFTEGRVSMFGQSNLLNQPEFNQDTSKLRKMLEYIENPSNMAKIINEKENEPLNDRFDVYIGSNDDEKLKDVSVVTTDININGHQLGKIALVGPTRMDYDKALSALEYIIEKFDEIYNERKEDEDGQRTN
ncbi:MAG: heat-inducible transcriptional repressor HrcA [Bacillales bacterium]|nr:heat-inducible transcriptional repressor HrcA [Bacillales bacterium]